MPIIRKYTTNIKEKPFIKVNNEVIINKNYISSIMKSDQSNPYYLITVSAPFNSTFKIYLFDEKDNSNPYYAKVEEFANKNSD